MAAWNMAWVRQRSVWDEGRDIWVEAHVDRGRYAAWQRGRGRELGRWQREGIWKQKSRGEWVRIHVGDVGSKPRFSGA